LTTSFSENPRIESQVIEWQGGFKYQLEEDFVVRTEILVNRVVDDGAFLRLMPDGWLLIRKGYAWDGPSGPTFDTDDFMIGSLVHDAFYQMLRRGLLPTAVVTKKKGGAGFKKETKTIDQFNAEKTRAAARVKKLADKELYNLCRRCGMPRWRAAYVYLGVRWFADVAASPRSKRKIRVVAIARRQ